MAREDDPVVWDAAQYLGFSDERSRPFVDLMARVGAERPARVVDLGCGPGNLTAMLAARWPDARIVGVDNSDEMITAARNSKAADTIEFSLGDARRWEPDGPVDVAVTNATLHWVAGHDRVLARMATWLAPGGWLAVQVPGNFTSPSHIAIAELCRSPRWAALLADAPQHPTPTPDAALYAGALLDAGLAVDAWETTYLHLLTGDDAVLEWVKGSALRPVLTRLGDADDDDRMAFLADIGERLRAAYPPGRHGTLFPFRRIFAVAHRRA
jgi:trans-aconitate 2-methyltransferase